MQAIAVIDRNKCKPDKCSHQCKRKCPVNITGKACIEIENCGDAIQPKVLAIGVRTIKQRKVAKINESICIGKACGICQNVCPFGAIYMVNIPSQLVENIVHSYGENTFRLYKLPLPKSSKIIGLLGRNGCGKTTILNILSKKIIPNFDQDVVLSEKKVLTKVRGCELQKYLDLLYSNKLKINTKQQDIVSKREKIGLLKVSDVLKKINTYPRYTRVVDELKLTKLLDNDVSTLSGGELQKLVCATMLIKEADVYIFDEPTNFLDIEYRIKIANLIRELISNDERQKFVFVVDHDLSILDFVADYIHIVYGEAGAYGVVSTLYPTLEAINNYFEGYIPADNMRFRKTAYKLNNNPSEDEKVMSNGTYYSSLINYKSETISFPNFKLFINELQLTDDTTMVIILGKNGCGKTTYLNFLKDKLGFQTSYKTQLGLAEYPKHITVLELLQQKIGKAMCDAIFKGSVVKALEMEKIYDKQVYKLSGGENQLLHITLCLGTPADVYLFDEPSASLDVERRFVITKVIKRFLQHNKKVGFIVEHDILMAISLAKESSSRIVLVEQKEHRCESSPLLDFNTGINRFLKSIDATFRTDGSNGRPRLNKLNSTNDRIQKNNNAYFK
jgi:ATP-binding cassette subfamily E protein 1